ncbi:toxin-antitoxin system YwqK family antitoxin [Pararhodonellum marinum]|uniref:toxin-antitoxin system YwqK family antitoxin n=1 Tax=Pararhodonellum marinum TaxID=2755358 RepID=UPI0018900850|nr:hypothetical protein [Pararhodonellum marinum]
MLKKYIPIFLSCFLIAYGAIGQEENLTDPDSSGVVDDLLLPTSAPILLFDDAKKEEDKKKKKKKKKKNIYFGEKTSKTFIKQSLQGKNHHYFIHYTSRYRSIDPYIRDIYWYNYKEKAIQIKGFDSQKGYLLHGPYEKKIDDVVVESGMFYFGTKHGRWMKFDNKSILLDKGHFSEGWPKDSRVTYYQREDRKVEKIIPVEYELEEGNFFHFYENGQVAVIGEYHFGEKVGLWTEYWNTNGGKVVKKREIQYQEQPFSKFNPYIRAEWDPEGNLVYRKD